MSEQYLVALRKHLKPGPKASSHPAIRVHFTTFGSGLIDELDKATRTVFYRVAQEALIDVGVLQWAPALL